MPWTPTVRFSRAQTKASTGRSSPRYRRYRKASSIAPWRGTAAGSRSTTSSSVNRPANGSPRWARGAELLVEHDLFGKPVSTFPDHALKPRQVRRSDLLDMAGERETDMAREDQRAGRCAIVQYAAAAHS